MSYAKKDRLFPIKPKAISDDELAEVVAASLRKDFGEMSSAIKRIGQLTGANLRAIKNWYEARHVPSSGHLLILARSSPSILKFVLEQVGGDDLRDAFFLLNARETGGANSRTNESHTDNSVSINVRIDRQAAANLNERQLWFMSRLQDEKLTKATDIASAWQINPRTAWRDIGGLIECGLIRFVGSKRTGRYETVKAGNLCQKT